MGDSDKHKSSKHYEKRRKNRYKDDDDDDDDDDYYKKRYNKRRDYKDYQKSAVERILTPGKTANNIVKTVATGIIACAIVLLMLIYSIAGDRLASASYLPLATLIAGAVTTACIWMFGRPKTEETYNKEFMLLKKELEDLNNRITDINEEKSNLEQRLANVEVLESFEDKLAKHTLEKNTKNQQTTKIASSIPKTSNTNASQESPPSSSATNAE